MKKYQVVLRGCDDSTYFQVELTEKEFALVKKISELSHKHSKYGCMPTMNIEEIKEQNLIKDPFYREVGE